MTTWMKLLEAKAFWGVDELQARLVAAVDERDAARKLYDERQDDWIAERESLQALNMQLVKNHDAMQAERDAARAEVERLREDAARNRWCEEKRAEVSWSQFAQRWRVVWRPEGYLLRQTSHADRNAAIDAARGEAI